MFITMITKCDHVIVDKADRITCTQEIDFCSAGRTVTHFFMLWKSKYHYHNKITLNIFTNHKYHRMSQRACAFCWLLYLTFSWSTQYVNGHAAMMYVDIFPWFCFWRIVLFFCCVCLYVVESYLFPPFLQHSNKPEQFWPSIGGVWEWDYQVDI